MSAFDTSYSSMEMKSNENIAIFRTKNCCSFQSLNTNCRYFYRKDVRRIIKTSLDEFQFISIECMTDVYLLWEADHAYILWHWLYRMLIDKTPDNKLGLTSNQLSFNEQSDGLDSFLIGYIRLKNEAVLLWSWIQNAKSPNLNHESN